MVCSVPPIPEIANQDPPDIDKDYLINLLKRLLATPSPVGMTKDVMFLVRHELQQLGLPTSVTRSGALKATFEGHDSSVNHELGFAAHLDTLGAMVTQIKPNGRVSLTPLGSLPARSVEGARALLHSREPIRGTFLPLLASGHAHYDEINTQPVDWSNLEMRLDIRSDSAADTHAAGVEVGDIVSLDPQEFFSDTGVITSRFLDNKAGVAALMAAVHACGQAGIRPARQVQLLFCVTEEVGGGAGHLVNEAIADVIAIDIALCAEGQNSHPYGVTIAFKDLFGPYDQILAHRLVNLAEDNGIAHARDVFPQYFSDARAIRDAGHDVRLALLGFGCDASHGYERTHTASLLSLSRLCVCAMRELNAS